MTSGPGKTATEEQEGSEREPFLSRWSRRKEEARQQAQAPAPQEEAESRAPAPKLPPLERLTLESDYRGFFHPKVSEDLRRAALKKLFSDPHFNVMDGLDVYIDDYSQSEPIPAVMLASLKQAQRILEWAKEDQEKEKEKRAPVESPHAAQVSALEPPADGAEAGVVNQSGLAETAPASPDAAVAGTKS